VGSIPQYQREQFASSYMGGAQKDDSGARIAGAINENLVEPIRKRDLRRLEERNDALTDLQANNAIIQYGLAYQNGLTEVQKKYAENPDAYPEAAVAHGQDLALAMSKAIPDAKIKAKFESAVASMQRQALPGFINWPRQD